MRGITGVIPRPTPITLGGRRFLASEFRLSDVADLQNWIDVRLPDPREAAVEILDAGDLDQARKKLLCDVVEAGAGWPKEPGSPEANALLGSEAGYRMVIALSLRREHPGLSGGDIRDIYGATTHREFSRLGRVAWGADPLRAVVELIDGPDSEGGDGPGWCELWHRWSTTASAAQRFEDLTITQFLAFRCGGQVPAPWYVDPARPDYDRVSARRKRFWGIEDDAN